VDGAKAGSYPAIEIAAGRNFKDGKVKAEAVIRALGGPSHGFVGTNDRCWILDSEGWSKFKKIPGAEQSM
jgi:hypothetical protein